MLKKEQTFFNNLSEVKMLTDENVATYAQGQLTAEVVLLIQPSVLDQAKKIMAESLHRTVEEVDSMIRVYYSCQPPTSEVPFFSWDSIKDSFLEFCQKAKAVILPPWVQVSGFRASEELLEKIAKDIVAVNRRIKIFALAVDGSREDLVHRVNNQDGRYAVSRINTFGDQALINVLQSV